MMSKDDENVNFLGTYLVNMTQWLSLLIYRKMLRATTEETQGEGKGRYHSWLWATDLELSGLEDICLLTDCLMRSNIFSPFPEIY